MTSAPFGGLWAYPRDTIAHDPLLNRLWPLRPAVLALPFDTLEKLALEFPRARGALLNSRRTLVAVWEEERVTVLDRRTLRVGTQWELSSPPVDLDVGSQGQLAVVLRNGTLDTQQARLPLGSPGLKVAWSPTEYRMALLFENGDVALCQNGELNVVARVPGARDVFWPDEARLMIWRDSGVLLQSLLDLQEPPRVLAADDPMVTRAIQWQAARQVWPAWAFLLAAAGRDPQPRPFQGDPRPLRASHGVLFESQPRNLIESNGLEGWCPCRYAGGMLVGAAADRSVVRVRPGADFSVSRLGQPREDTRLIAVEPGQGWVVSESTSWAPEGCDPRCEVMLWDGQDDLRQHWSGRSLGRSAQPFSPDGAWMALLDGTSLLRVSLASGETLQSRPVMEGALDYRVSPGGKCIFYVDQAFQVGIWHWQEDTVRVCPAGSIHEDALGRLFHWGPGGLWQHGHPDRLVSQTPNCETQATPQSLGSFGEYLWLAVRGRQGIERLQVVEPASARKVADWSVPGRPFRGFCFGQNGCLTVDGESARWWSLESRLPLARHASLGWPVRCEGQVAAVWESPHEVSLLSIPDLKLLGRLSSPGSRPLRDVFWVDESQLLGFQSNGGIIHWRLERG